MRETMRGRPNIVRMSCTQLGKSDWGGRNRGARQVTAEHASALSGGFTSSEVPRTVESLSTKLEAPEKADDGGGLGTSDGLEQI